MLKNILYCISILSLILVGWLAGEMAWSFRVGREKAGRLIEGLGETNSMISSNISEVLNQGRLERVDDYLNKQAAAALATSNNSRKVANNLNNLIREDMRPMIQDIHRESSQVLAALRLAIEETNHQIKQNGNSANALLIEARFTFADSHEQVIAVLQELRKVTEGLRVLTNDPELAAIIENLSVTTAHAEITSRNIEVITGDIAGLTQKYILPLYQPKKRGLLGKIGQTTLTVFRYATGASNIVYLVGRF